MAISPHSGKVAIVTGASSGIGKETARAFLGLGYQVHAVARRKEAMLDLESAGAILHALDLKEATNIGPFVQKVLRVSSRVDVLVNNAGYGFYGAVEEVPMQQARDQIEVNLFAPAALIQAVLPTMRQQRSGKIINVTSIGGKLTTPMGGWYHASKFGLEGLSDTLRVELRPFGIDVVLIEPAGVKTEWPNIAIDNMMHTSGKGPYRFLAEAFARATRSPRAAAAAAEPEQIARVIVRAATQAKPRARYVEPFSGSALLAARWLLSDAAFDWLFGKMFQFPKTL